MDILYSVIEEYINHEINKRKKKIDFLNNNYNLIYAQDKRELLTQQVNEIQELNSLLKRIHILFDRVHDLTHTVEM